MIADLASAMAVPSILFVGYVVWMMWKHFGMTSPRSLQRTWAESRPARENSREMLRTNPSLRWMYIAVVGVEFIALGLAAYLILHH